MHCWNIDETRNKQEFSILIISILIIPDLTCHTAAFGTLWFQVTSDQVKYPWLPWSQAAKASRNTWQFRCHKVAASFPPKKICFGLAGGIFRSDILTHSICYIFGKPLDDHSATGLGIGSFAISNALAESDWLSVMGLIGDLEFTKFKDASKIKRTKGRLIFRSLQRLQENRPWQSHLLQQAPIRPIFVDSSISARDPPK